MLRPDMGSKGRFSACRRRAATVLARDRREDAESEVTEEKVVLTED